MDGLGDRTPTQCLTTMLNLVPTEEQPGFLFRELFLRQLPAQVRTSLAQTTSTGSTREELMVLAEEADKYFRSTGARISAIQMAISGGGVRASDPFVVHPVSGGAMAFPAASGPMTHSSPTVSGGRLEDWSRDQLVNAVLGLKPCKWHRSFKAKAWSCIPPCSWKGPLAPKPGPRSGNSQPGQGRSQ